MEKLVEKNIKDLVVNDKIKSQIGKINLSLELDDAILLMRHFENIKGVNSQYFESFASDLNKSIVSKINTLKIQ